VAKGGAGNRLYGGVAGSGRSWPQKIGKQVRRTASRGKDRGDRKAKKVESSLRQDVIAELAQGRMKQSA